MNIIRARRIPILNEAGRDIIKAYKSFRIPVANLKCLNAELTRNIRIRRRRFG